MKLVQKWIIRDENKRLLAVVSVSRPDKVAKILESVQGSYAIKRKIYV